GLITGDAPQTMSAQSVFLTVSDDLRLNGIRFIDSKYRTNLRPAEPEAPGLIDEQRHYCPGGHSVVFAEDFEAPIAVARQATFPKCNPEIGGSVFIECVRPLEWLQALGLRITIEIPSGAFPSRQHFRNG